MSEQDAGTFSGRASRTENRVHYWSRSYSQFCVSLSNPLPSYLKIPLLSFPLSAVSTIGHSIKSLSPFSPSTPSFLLSTYYTFRYHQLQPHLHPQCLPPPLDLFTRDSLQPHQDGISPSCKIPCNAPQSPSSSRSHHRLVSKNPTNLSVISFRSHRAGLGWALRRET